MFMIINGWKNEICLKFNGDCYLTMKMHLKKDIVFYPALILISIMIMFIQLSGCAAVNKGKTGHGRHTATATVISSDKSPYYDYLKAEILNNRGQYNLAVISIKKAIQKDPDSPFLRKELIAFYLRQHDNDKALEAARDLVNLNPDDTDCLLIFAKLNQMLHHDNTALDIYHKILQLNPDNKKIYLILGRMYMEKKDIDDAFHLYSQMAKHFHNSYTAHFFLGKIHTIKKNPDYAEKEFLKCLEINPDLVEPRFELIEIYKAEGTGKTKPDKRIINLYKKILRIEPSDVRANLELPLYYLHHNKKKKAEKMFMEIGEKYAGSHGFYMKAARIFIKSKRYKDAAKIFTELLKGNPDDSTLHYLAGISFDGLEQTEKAIKQFLKIKPYSIYYKKIILHLAFLYNESGKRQKAIHLLEQEHDKYPENIDIIIYLSSFYEKEKQYDKAIKLLNQAIALSPDDADLVFRLGVVQDKSGEKEQCIQSMEKVIELDPDNSSALNYLGYTYAEMGKKLDLAEKLIKKALKLKPDDGYITDSLGWVFFKKGMYKKAEKILEKAVKLSSFDPVICEHLGDAFNKNKKYEKAVQAYKKAMLRSKKNKARLMAKIMQLENKIKESKNSRIKK